MEVDAGRKATLVLLSNMAGAALGYLALLLVGRYFVPEAYGAYLFALSLTGMFALLSNLGLGAAHQRHVAQGMDPGRALGVLVRLRAALGAVLLALFVAAYLLWGALGGRTLTDATTPTVLGLALVLQALNGARQVFLDTWQGRQQVHRIEWVRLVDTAIAVLLLGNAALMIAYLQGRWEILPGIGAFWARLLGFSSSPGPETTAAVLASCYLLGKAMTLALAWVWSLRDRFRLGPWDRELARSYIHFALPFALIGAIALVLQYTDTVMLGFFWTAREVGLYGAAQKLATLCLLAAAAVGTVLFPRFAQLRAAGDSVREAGTFDKSERYLTLLAAPLAAAMVALPREGIHVAVGDGYLEAALALQFLALWAFVGGVSTPLTSRLMGAGATGLLLRASALNAGLNAAFNLVLVPQAALGLGPAGSALATLLAGVISYVYLRAHGRQRYGIPWVSGHQARIVAAAALAGAAWAGAAYALGPEWFDRAWELAAWGVAGTALYALALAALGELHARDLAFLRKAAHPRALLAEMLGR